MCNTMLWCVSTYFLDSSTAVKTALNSVRVQDSQVFAILSLCVSSILSCFVSSVLVPGTGL